LLLDLLNTCYDPNMIVEMDPATNSFKYLEALLTVKENSILVQHVDKNVESVRKTGTLSLLNLQHFDSYHPTAIKRGLVISTLCRIQSYSSNDTVLASSVNDFFTVLLSLDYPLHVLLTAVVAVSGSRPSSNWRPALLFVPPAPPLPPTVTPSPVMPPPPHPPTSTGK
jgi:hypothetical protein